MLSRKWGIWLLAIVIALLPMPAIIKYLQTFIVRNAVVTAYHYEIRAPIDGVVEALDAEPGDTPSDSAVLVLRNNRVPHADIDSLEARYREKQKYSEVLQEELSALEIRLKADQSLFSDYRSMIQKDLDQTLAILKARQDGEAARLKEAAQVLKRNLALVETFGVSQAEVDQIEADFQVAEALFKTTRLEQEQIEFRRQMLQHNLLPSNLSDGGLQVLNQINNLQMEILDCRRRIHTAETDLAADAAMIQALAVDLAQKSEKAVILLPETAVIWAVDVRTGMEVAKGDRILSYIDRSRLMVEVAVDDATIELILPDHPVRIRLFGSGRFINGTVIQVVGSAADWPAHRFAAGVKGRAARDGRVLVQVNDPQLQADVKRFCGVGRTAYAEFEGIGLLEQYFGTFLR